jgi:hypothetical protein
MVGTNFVQNRQDRQRRSIQIQNCVDAMNVAKKVLVDLVAPSAMSPSAKAYALKVALQHLRRVSAQISDHSFRLQGAFETLITIWEIDLSEIDDALSRGGIQKNELDALFAKNVMELVGQALATIDLFEGRGPSEDEWRSQFYRVANQQEHAATNS